MKRTFRKKMIYKNEVKNENFEEKIKIEDEEDDDKEDLREKINEKRLKRGLDKLNEKKKNAGLKYKRGPIFNAKEASEHRMHVKKLKLKAEQTFNAYKNLTRTEILLPESGGYLVPDKNEKCYQITQKEIVDNVDITNATKHFNLNINFGPYFCEYYRNGRELLLGGKKGHVASMDWLTKELHCEFNVQESVHDISFLHIPTMFAVAQKDYVHIYDHCGTELHSLKRLFNVKKLAFLPYHFLLVSASESSVLTWTDVSIGKMIASFRPARTRLITCMKNNPWNGIVFTGHSNGVVNMWSPNDKEPIVKMLAHSASLRDVAIDHLGKYLVTCGIDRTMKIWDIRKYQCLQNYKLKSIPNCLDISQKEMISVSNGNYIEIYRECFKVQATEPYLRHQVYDGFVTGLNFCNFEDVLGISHEKGFTSILVPGCGEPNFDAFESNPFMTKKQRNEMEVKQLLEKIPSEMISLDPTRLSKVDVVGLKEIIEEKKKLPYIKVKDFEFHIKSNMTGVKKALVKKQLKDTADRKLAQEAYLQQRMEEIRKQKEDERKGKADEPSENEDKSVLDRFKKKVI